MTKRNSFWLALGVLCFGAAAGAAAASQSISVSWSENDYEFGNADGEFLSVDMEDPRSVKLGEPGTPELPWILVQVSLEAGEEVSSWNFEPTNSNVVARSVLPAPAASPRPSSLGGAEAVALDPAVYESPLVFPQERILYRGTQSRRGKIRASFLVSPFAWNPMTQELTFVAGGQIQFDTTSSDPSEFLGPSLRKAKQDATSHRSAPGLGRDLMEVDLRSSGIDVPTLEGNAYTSVLITGTELVDAFQPIVDWKTQSGTPATVRTVEWIYENYPGAADQAEAVRQFITDAYLYWGTESVILAGGPEYVPVRYAQSYSWDGNEGGTAIVADQYFACLDGNWNANGNSTYGQATYRDLNTVNDKVDFAPEVLVGRISASSLEEAELYVEKYISYVVNPIDDEYYNRALVLAELLFDVGWSVGDCEVCIECPGSTCARRDGAEDGRAFRDALLASEAGSQTDVTEMYERFYWWTDRGSPDALELDLAPAIAQLDRGQNLVFHSGHGNQDRWSIGQSRLTAADLLGLENAADVPRYSGMAYSINCNSAAVDFDCSAEGWMFAKQGGGLIYVGASNLDFPSVAKRMQKEMFSIWPGGGDVTPGQAYYESTAMEGAIAGENENSSRFVLYSLIFLGDPDMRVWSKVPQELTVQYDSSIELGSQSQEVTVSRNGSPVEGVKVAFYMAGQSLGVGTTGPGGSVQVPFAPNETGTFSVTATGPNKRPFQGTGTVAGTTSPFLALQEYTVDDVANEDAGIVGNGNGRIEVGETVAIGLQYRNQGTSVAAGFAANLSQAAAAEGIELTITDASIDLSDLEARETAIITRAFMLDVQNAIDADLSLDQVRTTFDLVWTNGSSTFVEQISPNAYRSHLEVFRATVVEVIGDGNGVPADGEQFTASFEMINLGAGTASGLQLRFLPNNPTRIAMLPQDGILPLSEAANAELATSSGSIQFDFSHSGGLEMVLFLEDTATDPPTRIWSRLYDLIAPTAPQTLEYQGTRDRIALQWSAPSDTGLLGYRVYRSETEAGTYERLGSGLIPVTSAFADSGYFADPGLPSESTFYYKVMAVDESGNESPLSEPIAATTLQGFTPGWPQPLGGLVSIAPTIEQLDFGSFEVIAGAEAVYAFHADGSDYYDGDQNSVTVGRLSEEGSGFEFTAKPAVADLDFPPDGQVEIVSVSSFTEENSTRWAELVCFDRFGRVRFRKFLSGVPSLGSPAIGDIDGDGDLEIVVLGGSNCYAFHHDGTPVAGTDGKIVQLSADEGQYLYGSVALGDVIEDSGAPGPALEIMFTTRSLGNDTTGRFYCVRGDGRHVSGFPYRYSDSGNGPNASNASPAVVDLDGDDYGEVFVSTKRDLWMFDPDQATAGAPEWRVDIGTTGNIDLNASPAIGDLNRDGKWEVVVGGASGRLYAVDAETGEPYAAFSQSAEKPYLQAGRGTAKMGSPIIGDLNGDRYPEVVVGDDDGLLHIYDYEGNVFPGYPNHVGGSVLTGLAMWDLDKDRKVDLVIQPDGVFDTIILRFSDTDFDFGNPDLLQYPWVQFRHDAHNTGSISTPPLLPLALQAPSLHANGLSVTLNWSAEAGFVAFELHRKLAGGESFDKIGSWAAADLETEDHDYRWVDNVDAPGTYVYQLVGIESDGFEVRTHEQSIAVTPVAVLFSLQRPQPNPFSGNTTIQFTLPNTSPGSLRVLDASGREVRVLAEGELPAGSHTLSWDGRDDGGRELGGGVYFVHFRVFGEGERSVKLVHLR